MRVSLCSMWIPSVVVVAKEVLMREGEARFFSPIMRYVFASLYIVLVGLIKSINYFHQKLITREQGEGKGREMDVSHRGSSKNGKMLMLALKEKTIVSPWHMWHVWGQMCWALLLTPWQISCMARRVSSPQFPQLWNMNNRIFRIYMEREAGVRFFMFLKIFKTAGRAQCRNTKQSCTLRSEGFLPICITDQSLDKGISQEKHTFPPPPIP